jgi:hypothetical protein
MGRPHRAPGHAVDGRDRRVRAALGHRAAAQEPLRAARPADCGGFRLRLPGLARIRRGPGQPGQGRKVSATSPGTSVAGAARTPAGVPAVTPRPRRPAPRPLPGSHPP